MAETFIDAPIEMYENHLKEAHKENVAKFFDNLVKKSGVNEQANIETVKKIRQKEAEIKAFDKKLGSKKKLRGFLIFLIVIGVIAAIVTGYLAYQSSTGVDGGGLPMWALILICVFSGLFAIGMLLLIILVVNKQIKNFREILKKLQAERDALEEEAWKQVNPLNVLYDWGMSAYLFTETVPIVKLDPYFDVRRFDYLTSKFNLVEQFDDTNSVEFVQSGEISGNPFLVTKKVHHYIGEKTYTGSLTVTWTVYYTDSNGHRQSRTESQTLVASVTKPYPEYEDETYLIYGNESAPKLHFSRSPLYSHKMSPKEIQKLIKEQTKKFDAKAKEAIKNNKSFNPLSNMEFEALWNTIDRDNELEYRLLFTPLSQQSMKKVLLDNKVGFGDDFYMVKDEMLNIVGPAHFNRFDFSANPNEYVDYEIAASRKRFNEYNNAYFKHMFFGFAPLLCIPEYQLHKPKEFIYKSKYGFNVSYWEHEAMANSMDVRTLEHSECVTRNILKTKLVQSSDSTDVLEVTAHGYKGIPRVDYVPKTARNGRTYQVPVEWTEYVGVWKKNTMVLKVQPKMTRLDYISNVLGKSDNQGWKNFLNGAYSNLIFRRNMLGFICNKYNSYTGDDDAALDELLK